MKPEIKTEQDVIHTIRKLYDKHVPFAQGSYYNEYGNRCPVGYLLTEEEIHVLIQADLTEYSIVSEEVQKLIAKPTNISWNFLANLQDVNDDGDLKSWLIEYENV